MIYKVVRQAISKELADFVYSYFLMKRKVAKTLFDARYISPFNLDWGGFNEPQIPNTYCHYGDIAMETLLDKLIEPMSKETGLNLVPTYTYARIDKKGDVFIFGPETRGLQNNILNSELNEEKIRVPMTKNNRSLNLSNTVAIVLYEAWRQTKFKKGI